MTWLMRYVEGNMTCHGSNKHIRVKTWHRQRDVSRLAPVAVPRLHGGCMGSGCPPGDGGCRPVPPPAQTSPTWCTSSTPSTPGTSTPSTPGTPKSSPAWSGTSRVSPGPAPRPRPRLRGARRRVAATRRGALPARTTALFHSLFLAHRLQAALRRRRRPHQVLEHDRPPGQQLGEHRGQHGGGRPRRGPVLAAQRREAGSARGKGVSRPRAAQQGWLRSLGLV